MSSEEDSTIWHVKNIKTFSDWIKYNNLNASEVEAANPGISPTSLLGVEQPITVPASAVQGAAALTITTPAPIVPLAPTVNGPNGGGVATATGTFPTVSGSALGTTTPAPTAAPTPTTTTSPTSTTPVFSGPNGGGVATATGTFPTVSGSALGTTTPAPTTTPNAAPTVTSTTPQPSSTSPSGSSMPTVNLPTAVPSGGWAAPTVTVSAGDTLSGIATAHDMSLSELESLNKQIKDPNLIYPGEKVNIGSGSPPTTSTYPPSDSPNEFAAGASTPKVGGATGLVPKDPEDTLTFGASSKSKK
jgi:LysM repeat protein